MSSIILGSSGSYVNIGTARSWRDHLYNHTFSAWVQTTVQQQACLVSLTNERRENFAVDICVSPHPSRDGTMISRKHESVPPTRFLTSVGSKVQKAFQAKALRPVKPAPGAHGALLGNLAGGLRVTLNDDSGNRVVAETPMPILADGAWHYIQVNVDKTEVSIFVDSTRVTVSYEHRDAELLPLDASLVGERVVYPSGDLIAGRYCGKEGVRDVFIGRLADVAVEIGDAGGHKLHWWVTDFKQGTTVWDRGSGAAHHPCGLHLHLCSCSWDPEDFPATSLYLNGFEGRKVEVPGLNEDILEELATADAAVDDENFDENVIRLETQGQTDNGLVLPSFLSPTGVPCSNSATPRSRSMGSSQPDYDDGDGQPQAPISQTMNREYFERVASQDRREPMSFSLWIRTCDVDPAILFTVPFTNPVHLIINLDCKPSVALVHGTDAFVSQCNVTDGEWHHIRWLIDPKTGASFFLDGSLAAWQYHSLSLANHDAIKKEGSVVFSAAGEGNIQSAHSNQSQSSAASGESLEEALRRRSLVRSMHNLHSGRKNSDGGAIADPQAELSHTMGPASNRRKSSVSFAAMMPPTVQAEELGFAAEESALFGEVLEDLECAEQASGDFGPGDKKADNNAATGCFESDAKSSPYSSQQSLLATKSFLMLSIKKRRQIISILNLMMKRSEVRKKNAKSFRRPKNAPVPNDESDELPVDSEGRVIGAVTQVTFGALFSGEIREVTFVIGKYTMVWRFDVGLGRQISCRVVFNAKKRNGGGADITSPTAGLINSPGSDQSDLLERIEFDAAMELRGRTSIFPKTILPLSSINLQRDTVLHLGAVRLPVVRDSTGIDVSLFLRLKKNRFGHVLTVSRVLLLEVLPDRLKVFVPSRLDASLLEGAKSKLPEAVFLAMMEEYAAIQEEYQLVACVCDTTLLEDSSWHHVRICLPRVGHYSGISVAIDEVPAEVSAEVVLEQFPSVSSFLQQEIGSKIKSPAAASSTRARLSMSAFGHPPTMAAASVTDTIAGDDLISTPQSVFKSVSSNPIRDEMRNGTLLLRLKRDLLLGSLDTMVMQPAAPGASYDCALVDVFCGGTTFHGSVLQVHLLMNGQEMSWRLTDGCRTKLNRWPPVEEPSVFSCEKKPNVGSNLVPMVAAQVLCDHDVHEQWQPTHLPSKALHFDGHTSFVAALNLRSNFHMSNLARFSVSLWMKAASSADVTVGPKMGCLFTVHDLKSPTTEGSCGIFTHTAVDNRTTPKKRYLAPFTTCFLLVDSCARSLCLEIQTDLYDGLWHKVQWVVYDSPSNESHVFIDDVAVVSKLVCGEQPREFRCRNPALNLGARNEGDNDVANHFVGEISCFRFSRGVDDDIVSWPMSEGEGNLLRDDGDKISGCVWAPDWLYTPFPPMNPVMKGDSVIEFSPIADIESSAAMFGVDISLSVKSNSHDPGVLWSIVSPDRNVLVSLTVNEGGDHQTRKSESGTHTLRLQRIVEKQIKYTISANANADVMAGSMVSMHASAQSNPGSDPVGGVGEGTPSLFPIEHPMTTFRPPRVSLMSAPGIAGAEDEVDIMSKSSLSLSSTGAVRKHRLAKKGDLHQCLADQKARKKSFGSASVSDLLKASGTGNTPQCIVRNVFVLEERCYQFHHSELCDGRWHEVVIRISKIGEVSASPTPLSAARGKGARKSQVSTTAHTADKDECQQRLLSDTSNIIFVDELDVMPFLVSVRNVRELSRSVLEEVAALPPSSSANKFRERTPSEKIRDQVTWASLVLGKPSSSSVNPALYCCVRNLDVVVHHIGSRSHENLLFVPFASNLKFQSVTARDVATTAVAWELSVPPRSYMNLGVTPSTGQPTVSYLLVPPVPQLRMNSFEVSFRLRSITDVPSCVVEFGSPSCGYFTVMLNQNAYGESSPNWIRFAMSDAEGRELHCACPLTNEDALEECGGNVDTLSATFAARSLQASVAVDSKDKVTRRCIDDNKWHSIAIRVIDSTMNFVEIFVDGIPAMTRFANCCAPNQFRELIAGGTIGAILDGLEPKLSLPGGVQNIQFANIVNTDEYISNPTEVTLRSNPVASWEATSGFASIVTDRSGFRNHALAINPVWKTDIQAVWSFPAKFPAKAEDVFAQSNICVTRWSNNTSDIVERNPNTGEVEVDDFPDDGWLSGGKGPQWISIDLGSAHTIFSIEVDLYRASPSLHEIFIARSNLSKSAPFHLREDPKDESVPQATFLESFRLMSASSRTLQAHLSHPLFNVRWIRVVAKDSALPAGYQSIRIVAMRGGWTASRKYSVSEAMGKSQVEQSKVAHYGPMLSMFPDTFVPGMNKAASVSMGRGDKKRRANRQSIQWGGPDDDEMGFWGKGTAGRFVEQQSTQATMLPPVGKSSITVDEGEDLLAATMRADLLTKLKKTSVEREREMKMIFYTQDVDRTGFISLVDFMSTVRDVDVTGLISEERILVLLRDAGVSGSLLNFEQFMKVFAKVESW